MTRNEVRIPKRRFKEFESAEVWEQRKLGELGSVEMNKRIYKGQTSSHGDIPFYKIGTFGGEPDTFITRELYEEYQSKYPYPKIGDILISASGSIGKTVVYSGKKEYFQDSNIVWINHKNRIDNSFLKCFYSFVQWVGLEGSTIKRLYNNNILNTYISLPSLSEQQKIGDFFKNLDDMITIHQRKLEKLKALKTAYLAEMFPSDGESKPKLRFKGFADDWEQRELGDLASHRGGTALEKYFDSYGKYKVISIGSYGLDSTYIDQGIRVSSNEVTDSRVVCSGELTMVLNDKTASGAIIGRSLLIRENDTYVINQRTEVVSPKKNLDSEFAYVALNGIFREKVKKVVQGGTQIYVNYPSIAKLTLILPSWSEQRKIGDFFKTLDDTIAIHQRKLEKLQNIKQAYLNEMFV